MPDLGYAAAFLGGLLALLSPCSALLLPSFFAYAVSGRTELVARTSVFLVGLAVVLVPLGAGSGALAGVLTQYRTEVVTAAGVLIIVLGVVQILGGGWAFAPAARFQSRMARRGTWLATLGLGAAYGLAGFCSGPILGAVLTVAAASGQAVRGAALLAVYAVGMAVPLFVLALLWQRFNLGSRRWLRGRTFHVGPLTLHTTSTVSGLLFVVIGVLFVVYDGTAGLVGADPATAAGAENTAVAVGSSVPDLVVLGVVAVVTLAVVGWRLRSSLSSSRRSR
ncbi:cytochrome c biogenesis CcdA family protein [Actinomycetospora termitidis]|uniref:Cytochrome c biogenesis CcdA family protein n=1 Tax=Actinomycetospora termitidis TaxID=3053470 RepID=A0ABT7MDX0_9PSEU|nr:cytochrome c biogenesis CcdA family protein [Actinomycetospora sp. Odt1-22]MDL5158866.1 cytochrome c biogenesis CcdA family protein [Actinomycetospora sp. Odt1-22]